MPAETKITNINWVKLLFLLEKVTVKINFTRNVYQCILVHITFSLGENGGSRWSLNQQVNYKVPAPQMLHRTPKSNK